MAEQVLPGAVFRRVEAAARGLLQQPYARVDDRWVGCISLNMCGVVQVDRVDYSGTWSARKKGMCEFEPTTVISFTVAGSKEGRVGVARLGPLGSMRCMMGVSLSLHGAEQQ